MATARACFVVFVVVVVFLFLNRAEAAGRTAGWSVQRRQQMHSLLKRLNKKPVTSIESPDGDIIDCVHISKQPAFDHPFIKYHAIQMCPSYLPEGMPEVACDQSTKPITQMWHQNGKCPDHTIPIRRIKEEDVLRAKSVKRYGMKRPRSIPNPMSFDNNKTSILTGHQWAVASSEDDIYYGTNATINLWQPTLERPNDFSLAQLWIKAGSYNNLDLNTIEAGWQVSQDIYGDNNTRIFIYWTRDAYQTTGCYNLRCSGFIQTSNQIAIGGSISPVSIYNGSQYDINIYIRKDPKDGNWWLQLNSYVLGYWPGFIFSHLADNASSINWGGEVYSPDANQTTTPMGSGHFPEEGFGKASYIKNIQVLDSSNNLKSPSNISLIARQPNCYNVLNSNNSDWGTYIYFGGPGKNPNCP
ncbi:hypothetical protein EJB05_51769, partial [Eragrostis curvula]